MRKISLLFIFTLCSVVGLFAQNTVICKEIGYFNNGLAPVLVDNQWGFVDKTGKIVIEPQFKAWVEEYGALPAFSEGFTTVVDTQTDRVGYINLKGEMVIPAKFYSGSPFRENVAFARLQDEKVLIDTAGKVIARGFVALNGYHSHFSHDLAVVQKEFAYGYINKEGKFAIEPVYEEAKDFADGLAAVKKDGKWGFIDTLGNTRVPFQFTREPKSFSDYRAFVQGTNNKWGIIDTIGKLIVNPQYHQVWPFGGGVAVVSIMDEKFTETFYLIDVNGKVLKTYAKAANYSETITFWSGFQEGLAVAMKGHKKGFIDPQGKVVVDFLYRDLHPLQDGMAWFEKYDDKTRKVTKGYLDKTGKVIMVIEPPMF
ncbi:MAG: WG repeat-containing protein [Bacteroidales bacterium]